MNILQLTFKRITFAFDVYDCFYLCIRIDHLLDARSLNMVTFSNLQWNRMSITLHFEYKYDFLFGIIYTVIDIYNKFEILQYYKSSSTYFTIPRDTNILIVYNQSFKIYIETFISYQQKCIRRVNTAAMHSRKNYCRLAANCRVFLR